jgi:hypothetical protein
MQSIIDKTEIIAVEYLSGLGFGREQIAPLLAQARKDREEEFARLEMLRSEPAPDPEALDRVLHAIKGLLFNLGNHDLAEKLEALRHEEDLQRMLPELDRVLREAAQ